MEILLYVASPIALLVTSPILAQGLGEAGRGELGLAQSIVAFAVACGSLGQAEVYLSREQKGAATFREGAFVAWVGASLSAVVAASVLIKMDFSNWLVIAGFLLIVVQSQVALWRALSVRSGRLMRPALAMALGAAIRVAAISGLYAIGWLSVPSSFAIVQGAIVIGALAFLAPLALACTSDRSQRMTLERFRSFVIAGAPVLLFHACTTITLNGNLFVLNGRVSREELGVFAAAIALANASLSVSGAFRSRVQAAFYAAEISREVRRELAVSTAVAAIGAGIASSLSPLIVQIFLGDGYESAVLPLRILFIASGVLILMDCVHGALAIIVKRTTMVVIAAAGAAVLLSSTIWLTPTWGIVGAAVATLLGYGVVATIGMLVIARYLRLST